jgi:hypothetical protein
VILPCHLGNFHLILFQKDGDSNSFSFQRVLGEDLRILWFQFLSIKLFLELGELWSKDGQIQKFQKDWNVFK